MIEYNKKKYKADYQSAIDNDPRLRAQKVSSAPCGTKEMMQPFLIYRHLISLIARWSSGERGGEGRARYVP